MIVDADDRNPPDLRARGVSSEQGCQSVAGCRKRTSSIEQTQCIRVITDHHSDSIVIEHLSPRVCVRLQRDRQSSLTVGTYSLGNLLVVYDINKHV